MLGSSMNLPKKHTGHILDVLKECILFSITRIYLSMFWLCWNERCLKCLKMWKMLNWYHWVSVITDFRFFQKLCVLADDHMKSSFSINFLASHLNKIFHTIWISLISKKWPFLTQRLISENLWSKWLRIFLNKFYSYVILFLIYFSQEIL